MIDDPPSNTQQSPCLGGLSFQQGTGESSGESLRMVLCMWALAGSKKRVFFLVNYSD
jgi:hypothetical protein